MGSLANWPLGIRPGIQRVYFRQRGWATICSPMVRPLPTIDPGGLHAGEGDDALAVQGAASSRAQQADHSGDEKPTMSGEVRVKPREVSVNRGEANRWHR